MITVNQDNIFHLQTKNTSYLFRVLKSGQLEALYYGRKIRNTESFGHLYDKHLNGFSNSVAYSQDDTSLSLDHTGVLGETIEEIAFEKCGTIKENGNVICSFGQPRGAIKVIEKT